MASAEQVVDSLCSQWEIGNETKKITVSLAAIALMPHMFGGKRCLTTYDDFIINGLFFGGANFVRHIIKVKKALQSIDAKGKTTQEIVNEIQSTINQ